MRYAELIHFTVKHKRNHIIAFTHLSAENEEDARKKILVKFPGTAIEYVRQIGA